MTIVSLDEAIFADLKLEREKNLKKKKIKTKTFLQYHQEYNYYKRVDILLAEELVKESIRKTGKNPKNFYIKDGVFFPIKTIKIDY